MKIIWLIREYFTKIDVNDIFLPFFTAFFGKMRPLERIEKKQHKINNLFASSVGCWLDLTNYQTIWGHIWTKLSKQARFQYILWLFSSMWLMFGMLYSCVIWIWIILLNYVRLLDGLHTYHSSGIYLKDEILYVVK